MIACAASLALLSFAPAASQVHTVANVAEFLAALDSAAPGDTIRIENENLFLTGPISLGKGLRLSSAHPNGTTLRIVDGFVVEDVPADEEVVLRSIHFATQSGTQTVPYLAGAAALVIRNCDGPVHVLGGSVKAGSAYPGMSVEGSHEVFVTGAALRGGAPVFVSYSSVTPGDARPGLMCADSSVSLQGVEVTGGSASLDCAGSAALFVSTGADAVLLLDSNLVASRCTLEGGDALQFWCSSSPCGMIPGGNGIKGSGASTALLRDCGVIGGKYPSAPEFCGVPSHADGIYGFDDLGAWVIEEDSGVSLELDPWVAIQDGPGTIRVETSPGHAAFALVDTAWHAPVPVQGIDLYLTPDTTYLLSLGTAGGQGKVSMSYPVPGPIVGPGGVEAWVQAFSIDALASQPLRASFAAGMQRLP